VTLAELERVLEHHGWVSLRARVSVAGLEAERISTEPCGCRVDLPTGVRTYLCPQHEEEA